MWRSAITFSNKLLNFIIFENLQNESRAVLSNWGIGPMRKLIIGSGKYLSPVSWWRHQMEAFSALLDLCAGNSPVTVEFPAQRPVTRSFDVFFDLRLNKRLSKQSWGWWFQTLSRPLWRHCNVTRSLPLTKWNFEEHHISVKWEAKHTILFQENAFVNVFFVFILFRSWTFDRHYEWPLCWVLHSGP